MVLRGQVYAVERVAGVQGRDDSRSPASSVLGEALQEHSCTKSNSGSIRAYAATTSSSGSTDRSTSSSGSTYRSTEQSNDESAIIGIVAAIVFAVAIAIGIGIWCIRAQRKKKQTKLELIESQGYHLWEDETIVTTRIPREKVILETLISSGGYGEVYRGSFDGQPVAIKMLPQHSRRNIQLVNAYDSNHHPTGFDYVKIIIAFHVAQALTYLHSLQPMVLHRDLKSRNILVTHEMVAKLTDFGVSRERSDATMTAGVGTSLWMAPEVLLGHRYDEKADVFSFGVVLSELDSHVLPYAHAKSSQSGNKLSNTAILQMVSLGSLHVQFSENAIPLLKDLGQACVSMDPAARPSAAEVLYHLQLCLKAC
ncbi:Protein kinase-like domain [Phytophthora cactorum]|nr:Protein kinase-like domain [Phytophthora cactorum]